MQFVNNIEKTLRKKQAESQTELEILRIKYGNLKVNYRSMDMQHGLNFLTTNRARSSRQLISQSCGRDSEVVIGQNNQSLVDISKPENTTNNFQYKSKMSPLAFHKMKATSQGVEPTPSTKCGGQAFNGEFTANRQKEQRVSHNVFDQNFTNDHKEEQKSKRIEAEITKRKRCKSNETHQRLDRLVVEGQESNKRQSRFKPMFNTALKRYKSAPLKSS